MSKRKMAAAGEQGRTKASCARAGRESVVIAALASLVVGFVCGMAFQAYRTGSTAEREGVVSTPAPAVDPEGAEARHRALHELEAATTAEPGNAETWARLGNAYFDENRYREAIEAYRRSLDIDPNQAGVWTDLGVMYRRSGEPEEAIRAFDRAVEVDPEHEVSRFNKGVVLLHDLEDLQGAIRAWEGLLEVNPTAMAPNGQPVMSLVEQFKQMKSKE